MKTIILPVGNRILVSIEEAEQPSKIIFIPEQFIERPNRGKVLAIGRKVETELRVGDEVWFNKVGGLEMHVDGEPVRLLEPKEILGKVEA